MKIRIMIMMLCVLAFTAAAFAQDSIPPNGSFERGNLTGDYETKNPGSLDIYHWTINHSVDYIGSYWQASEGVRSIDLNAFEAGSITSDVIPTTPGATYQVTFDMSGNPDLNVASNPEYDSPSNKTMIVSIDGGTQPQTYSYDTSVAQNTRTDMKWATNTYTFTATGTSTRLTFASTTPGAFGPALDNVNTTQLTFAVCHIQGGNGKNVKTKTLYVDSQDSVNAHVRHGDTAGVCSSNLR